MKCNQVIKKLSTYLDNEVGNDLRQELENHLKTCHACSREYEILAGNAKFMLSLPEIEPFPYFTSRTWAKIRQTKESKNRFFLWVPVPATAVLILILLSYFLSFGMKVSALESETRNRLVTHTIQSAVKGSHLLGPVSFKRFCKKSCDILCECGCLRIKQKSSCRACSAKNKNESIELI